MLPVPSLNSYLAMVSASYRPPPEAMMPCCSISACEITHEEGTLVAGIVLAKFVMAASIWAALPGQSGAPPAVVGQQWCDSLASRSTKRDAAGSSRLIFDCA